jgi:hypothetical protein
LNILQHGFIFSQLVLGYVVGYLRVVELLLETKEMWSNATQSHSDVLLVPVGGITAASFVGRFLPSSY